MYAAAGCSKCNNSTLYIYYLIERCMQCVAFRQKKVDDTANSMTIYPPQERKSTRRSFMHNLSYP